MVISRKKNPSVVINDHIIEHVKSFKLGVSIAPDLSWQEHIKSICLCSKKLIGFLFRIFCDASSSYLCHLYKTPITIIEIVIVIYTKHRSLSLRAEYLILLINFSAFVVSLFTQPDGQTRIHGKVISPQLPVRNYCTGQLFTAWHHLQQSTNMLVEDVAMLVKICLETTNIGHNILSYSGKSS